MTNSAHTVPSVPSPPKAAFVLGGLGLVPFLALAVLAHLQDPVLAHIGARALVAYGAVIVAFLGGIRWGLALGYVESHLWIRLTQSIVPSLTGFAALLLPTQMAVAVLTSTLALMLWWDVRLTQEYLAPTWYPRLRIPLSIGAGMALLSLLV